jgi:hypothetical protein
MRRELGALTKSGKTLGVGYFYSVIVSMIFDLFFFQDVIQYMQLNDPTGRWVQNNSFYSNKRLFFMLYSIKRKGNL